MPPVPQPGEQAIRSDREVEGPPAGGVVDRVPDGRGHAQRRHLPETDAAARTTRYRYDAAGRVEGITYPGGATRSFVYGRAGNLLRAINPGGGVTRYDYDASGQLVRVTDPVDRVAMTRRVAERVVEAGGYPV